MKTELKVDYSRAGGESHGKETDSGRTGFRCSLARRRVLAPSEGSP
jgi:hypothetical protein